VLVFDDSCARARAPSIDVNDVTRLTSKFDDAVAECDEFLTSRLAPALFIFRDIIRQSISYVSHNARRAFPALIIRRGARRDIKRRFRFVVQPAVNSELPEKSQLTSYHLD